MAACCGRLGLKGIPGEVKGRGIEIKASVQCFDPGDSDKVAVTLLESRGGMGVTVISNLIAEI
jgi:hypothetical protein